LQRHGLKSTDVAINPAALSEIIEEYTRESGVRNLRRPIAAIFRQDAGKNFKCKKTTIFIRKRLCFKKNVILLPAVIIIKL